MLRCAGSMLKTLEKFKCLYSSSRAQTTKMAVLPNGLRVVTEESESLMACVALFVEAGPLYESPTNYGITHFIEHMAYRGFTSMNQLSLHDHLASIGATMTASTTREFQVFSGKCLSENASEVVSVLSKIVTELELSPIEIEMAKYMIELESRENENNPKELVSDFLHETAFQGTPLGRPVIGPSWIVKKINKYALECYMKQWYLPSRFVLATSGISHVAALRYAHKYFDGMNNTGGDKYRPLQRYTGSQKSYRDDSKPFVHVVIAVEAPGMRSSDYLTMLLASNIIGSWSKSQGGDNRHGSPLARAAATSSILCDSFESFYIPYRDVGLWGVYIVADKLHIDGMIINVQEQWMKLCITTSSNDVERGRNMTKLELAKKHENSVKSCYDIGIQTLYKAELRSLPEMFETLSQINEKTVREVAGSFIYDKCPVYAAVGPTEVLPDYVRLRTGMYWLRL